MWWSPCTFCSTFWNEGAPSPSSVTENPSETPDCPTSLLTHLSLHRTFSHLAAYPQHLPHLLHPASGGLGGTGKAASAPDQDSREPGRRWHSVCLPGTPRCKSFPPRQAQGSRTLNNLQKSSVHWSLCSDGLPLSEDAPSNSPLLIFHPLCSTTTPGRADMFRSPAWIQASRRCQSALWPAEQFYSLHQAAVGLEERGMAPRTDPASSPGLSWPIRARLLLPPLVRPGEAPDQTAGSYFGWHGPQGLCPHLCALAGNPGKREYNQVT